MLVPAIRVLLEVVGDATDVHIGQPPLAAAVGDRLSGDREITRLCARLARRVTGVVVTRAKRAARRLWVMGEIGVKYQDLTPISAIFS